MPYVVTWQAISDSAADTGQSRGKILLDLKSHTRNAGSTHLNTPYTAIRPASHQAISLALEVMPNRSNAYEPAGGLRRPRSG
jgi:hypothetical protein